jgi:hypothetical protein
VTDIERETWHLLVMSDAERAAILKDVQATVARVDAEVAALFGVSVEFLNAPPVRGWND